MLLPSNPWVSIGNSPFQLKLLTFHRKPGHCDTFQLHHFKHLSNVESFHTPFSLKKNFNTAHQSHPSPMHLQFRQAPGPCHRWQQGPQAPWSKDGFGSVIWKNKKLCKYSMCERAKLCSINWRPSTLHKQSAWKNSTKATVLSIQP